MTRLSDERIGLLPLHHEMRDVLLINTGGTIAMQPTPAGLAPAEGLVEEAARRLAPSGLRVMTFRFDPLIDSASIDHRHWNRMLAMIENWSGDGVLITHGTDTLAFTGAALTEALGQTRKSVVLCAAMKPLGTGGDAEDNLRLALETAASGRRGVYVAMGGKLMHAGRLVKHHATEPQAFRETAPSMPPSREEVVSFRPARLAILTLSPGLGHDALEAMLARLDGAVLRVYGSGTVADDPELHDVLRRQIARGLRLRAVSQCEQGGLIAGAYAAGAALWSAGVENGFDETPEAALVKVWLDLSAVADGTISPGATAKTCV